MNALTSLRPTLLRTIPAERHSDDPQAEIRAGKWLAAGFVLSVLAAGLLVPLDAAVMAPGVVKVLGERQKLQSSAEGSVSLLAVAEGQRVKAGDVLIRLATADAQASERSLATRVIGLQAEIARLEAEQLGAAEIMPPAAFAAYDAEDRGVAARALAMEAAQLRAARRTAASEEAILRQQIGQIGEQIRGSSVRRAALQQQRKLLDQELTGIRALAARGYASRNRVLELERSDADLAGSVGAMAAETARLHGNTGETRLQIDRQRADRLQKTAERLRDARTELATLLPQRYAAREELSRTVLRAPVSGSVVGLTLHTVGGFVPRGETLLEIVPEDKSLVIEARLDVADGNAVHAGDPARLRLPAAHGRNAPELHGTVESISADSFADDRSGRSFYRMGVRVSPEELARLQRDRRDVATLRPGNPVNVNIAVRSRSALGYWLEPLFQSLSGAMHEQ